MSQENNSKTLGILAIVFAILAPGIGLILSIVGLVNKNVSAENKKLCKIALFVSIGFILFNSIIIFPACLSLMSTILDNLPKV